MRAAYIVYHMDQIQQQPEGSSMVMVGLLGIALAALVFLEIYRRANRRWGENP
jgi:hypothetical protein